MKKNKTVARQSQTTKTQQRPRRVPYDRDLVLRLEDGRTFVGRAKNISSNGFIMVTGLQADAEKLEGAKAFLQVELDVESFELPCKIVRMGEDGLAATFI